MRSINVLIDRDAIVSRAAAKGEPWRFYDLGHGLCTYEFFDQCPHRMACAKYSCYRPMRTTHAQLLEAKANLLHLKQEIPLTDEELSPVDDGLGALERLCSELADVPTPAGPTPRDLASGCEVCPIYVGRSAGGDEPDAGNFGLPGVTHACAADHAHPSGAGG